MSIIICLYVISEASQTVKTTTTVITHPVCNFKQYQNHLSKKCSFLEKKFQKTHTRHFNGHFLGRPRLVKSLDDSENNGQVLKKFCRPVATSGCPHYSIRWL